MSSILCPHYSFPSRRISRKTVCAPSRCVVGRRSVRPRPPVERETRDEREHADEHRADRDHRGVDRGGGARSFEQQINENLMVSADDELEQLTRRIRGVADATRESAPATAGFLDGVADDLAEAQSMLDDEMDEPAIHLPRVTDETIGLVEAVLIEYEERLADNLADALADELGSGRSDRDDL